MTKIYDEICAWPYHVPYGMVTAPKVKKPRKPRKSRAKPEWLKEITRKAKQQLKEAMERSHGTSRKRRPSRKPVLVLETPAQVRQTPILEATPQGFAETFVTAALLIEDEMAGDPDIREAFLKILNPKE